MAADVVAPAWPGSTALALTIRIAAWALTTGAIKIALAFQRGESAGERTLFPLPARGLDRPAFVLLVGPEIGAGSPATVLGLFSIFYGASAVFGVFDPRSRRTGASRSDRVSVQP
ncbi:DUF308 domain-containing protein [Streptomyces sp. NPDC092369]|uniref:DUF308 domain-containing protein n=1 Tax=Streptomyces sp. NPDC092369 TaxID=3366015 RepID=UPI0037FEE3F6